MMYKKQEQTYGVSAAHPLAAGVGVRVLEEGGNAVDAAVAVTFALGVVEPYASGIGGGGNMLIFDPAKKEPIVYDYRETAPSHVHDMYNIGVPGVVRGMEKISKDLGKRSLAQAMQPAIELAESGFDIHAILARNLAQTKHTHMFEIPHFYPNKQPLQQGNKLIQYELAETMKQIAREGSNYFYRGKLAQKLIHLQVGMTEENLQNYEAVQRKPIKGTFRGHDIFAAPAPSGGALIMQALKVIERLNIDQLNPHSPSFMTMIGTILQTCYSMRDTYIGDPAFVPIHEQELLDEERIGDMIESIEQATSPSNVKMVDENHTTHFSVIDQDGMVVSTTNTLSNFFGSGVYIDGLFLNNQMQNFSPHTSSPNRFEVGKRCHSLISPTIVSNEGIPWLAIGASGAARIPTLITTVLIKYLIHGYSIEEAIQDKRHYTFGTDFYSEKDLLAHEQLDINQAGYRYKYYPNSLFYGGVQAVLFEHENVHGAGDPRRGGVFRSNCTLHKKGE